MIWVYISLTVLGILFIYIGIRSSKKSERPNVYGNPLGELFLLILSFLPWYLTKALFILTGIMILLLNVYIYFQS